MKNYLVEVKIKRFMNGSYNSLIFFAIGVDKIEAISKVKQKVEKTFSEIKSINAIEVSDNECVFMR